MMAPGENRFSATMSRQMPVLAQSQTPQVQTGSDGLEEITVTAQSQNQSQLSGQNQYPALNPNFFSPTFGSAGAGTQGINRINYYVAGRLDFTSLFAVWTTSPDDLLPTYFGVFQIDSAPCILVCFFTPSEWNHGQSPVPGPVPGPPTPLPPPLDGST
jgi:hypothetical protein